MTVQHSLTLLACQIEIPQTRSATARDAHLADTSGKIRQQLGKQSADVVVLPELSSIEYSREAFDALDQIAEPLDGPTFQTWAAIAVEFGVFVTYSFARRDANGTYICAAVVTPDGKLAGHYDKLHLCHYGASMEKDYFTAGDQLMTFKVKGFTLSPIICYDIRFPELSRTLVLDHGVDVILHSGAYYRDPSFHMWHAFAMTRAIENQCFFLSLNRAGEHFGNSLFCYPWMDENLDPLSFDAHAEDFKFITLERQMMDTARSDYTFLRDKRDTYNRAVISAD